MPLIEVKDLTVHYETHLALDHLSFKVEAGDYISIIGANGAGKSTLIKALLGLQHYEGDIQFKDEYVKKQIGYLAQQPQIARDFPATVEEVVLSGNLNQAGLKLLYNKEDHAKAKFAMEETDILDLRKKSYQTCSGGQKQRVLLARALCASAGILVLDEPLTGLDESTKARLYQILTDLNQNHHYTILMVTHDREAAIQYSSKILSLSEDQVFYGSCQEFQEYYHVK